MKKRLLEICLFLTLFGLMLLTPIVRVSASSIKTNLQLTNLVGININYTYDQLLAMPQTTISATLSCYGNLLVTGDWGGVSLGYLLQQVGVDPAVASINFHATDGYTVIIPLSEATAWDTIIAYELNGSPLPEVLRLVVPEENGNIWISSIVNITMSASDVANSQSGISTSPRGLQAPTSQVGQSSMLQVEPFQTQSAAPKNVTTTDPTAPPANTTPIEQKGNIQQKSVPEDLVFSTGTGYEIALVATVSLVAVCYVTYRHRHVENRS
jgi:DMSO/TMAO reductase YedYZ molybdopterin-dependent catalytic subunit